MAIFLDEVKLKVTGYIISIAFHLRLPSSKLRETFVGSFEGVFSYTVLASTLSPYMTPTIFHPRSIVVRQDAGFGTDTSCCCHRNMSCVMLWLCEATE